MYRLLLLALLLLPASPVWAEWVQAGYKDSAIHYIDPGTLREDGQFRRVWMLVDYSTAQKHIIESAKVLQEVDCKEQRLRRLHETYFTWPMAYGRPIGFYAGRSEWRAVVAGTPADATFKFACGE